MNYSHWSGEENVNSGHEQADNVGWSHEPSLAQGKVECDHTYACECIGRIFKGGYGSVNKEE